MAYDKKTILGLINARGGSKGIPRKNIKVLCGKPLIVYSIEAGLACSYIDDLVVSTEDNEIAGIAKKAGALVPFIRPSELSGDTVRQIGAVIHAVNFMEKEKGKPYDYIMLLQPTTPLRTADDINSALRMLITNDCDSVIAFSPIMQGHPYDMYSLEGEYPQKFITAPRTQRQQYPALFRVNGAIYTATRSLVVEKETFYGSKCRAYVMPPERSINIDNPFDWDIAECCMQRYQKGY